MRKKKHRWATVKGKVVSVRFSEVEYRLVDLRARNRGLSVGDYLKWLTRSTTEYGGYLEVLE